MDTQILIKTMLVRLLGTIVLILTINLAFAQGNQINEKEVDETSIEEDTTKKKITKFCCFTTYLLHT